MGKSRPIISVITVVYNGEKGLENTMLSILNQNYINIEYIIVDGGSTDSTKDIIRKYEEKISYWVSEPDMGIYDAMNKGVKLSQGEWIIFMNSGDIFNNKEVILQIFSSHIDTMTHIIYGNTLIENTKISPPATINKKYFFFDTICHQSIFIRRSVFEEIGYHNLNYKILSDREFLLRAVIRKLNFKYVDVDVCLWETVGFSSQNIHLFQNELSIIRNIHFNSFENFSARFGRIISRIKKKMMPI